MFASLIMPALACRHIAQENKRLLFAYCIGLLGYILGLSASLLFDLPTGAIIVWTLLLACLLFQALLKQQPNLLK